MFRALAHARICRHHPGGCRTADGDDGRRSPGLFLAPIDASTGLGVAALNFALAVGQLMWGVAQPVAGALADHYSARPVLLGGLLLLAAGCALTPLMNSATGFSVTLGLLAAIGSGAGSFWY